MKTRVITYFLLLVLTGLGYSQSDPEIDSLEIVLQITNDPSEKVGVLLALSEKIYDQNPAEALKYAEQSYKLSGEQNDQDLILKSTLRLARIYQKKYELGKTLEYASKLKELAEDIHATKEYAISLQILGIIYIDLGKYDLGSDYLFKSYKIYEEIKDSSEISKANNLLGYLYSQLNDNDKALEYYFKMLNYSKELNYNEGIASALNNIATVFIKRNNFEKATHY